MADLTPDDVRHWDLFAIEQIFDAATGRSKSLATMAGRLQQVQQSLSDWGGDSGDAFRTDITKAISQAHDDAEQTTKVATAAAKAEEDVRQCRSAMHKIDDLARANSWTITPDWKVDIGNTDKGRAVDLGFIAAWQGLQDDLNALHTKAVATDEELAATMRAAVGDSPLPTDTPPPAAPADPAPLLTPDQLHQIFPTLPPDKLDADAKALSDAMRNAGMTSPESRAAFLATFAVESGELKYDTELRNEGECTKMYGPEYAGVTFPPGTFSGVDGPYTNSSGQLGNTQPGDGYRYRGRGPIQLTGRSNYAQAGQAIGVDLVDHPELAADPANEFKVATWYWNNHQATLPDGSRVPLNTAAETGNFKAVTFAINGGYTGYQDRLSYFNKAVAVLK